MTFLAEDARNVCVKTANSRHPESAKGKLGLQSCESRQLAFEAVSSFMAASILNLTTTHGRTMEAKMA